MPTSSQSRILSAVDYQLIQQQAQQQQIFSGPDATATSGGDNSSNQQKTKNDRRLSCEKRGNDHNKSPSPSNLSARRRSSLKNVDGTSSTLHSSQYSNYLHVPTIYLNQMVHNESNILAESSKFPSNSLDDENQLETEINLKKMIKSPSRINPVNVNDSSSSSSDLEHPNLGQRNSLLNEYTRRLLILGTIRPSRTFYKDLPEADVEHLMEYFRRMRKTNQKLTSEEINQELKTKFIEYKPKIFFDSSLVTKTQVIKIEKIVEQYADKIRTHKAELIKLDNPLRFVIKQTDNEIQLTTIPQEYNDCFLTLINRTDPLHKSNLITELVQDKLLEDVKANSLDISYFPGGINYDLPIDEINENGQMNLETYQKLKKRLKNRKIWYFNGPPEKKPNALLAIIPIDLSISINHQRLFDALFEHLKTISTDENFESNNKILSIEFVPLSCILNSYDIENQFIIDCDTIQTKQKLMEKPMKISSSKQTITIELHSYDDEMHKEYERSNKAEKYKELIKNHDEAIRQSSSIK